MISKEKKLPPVYINLDEWLLLDLAISLSLKKVELTYFLIDTIRKIEDNFKNST